MSDSQAPLMIPELFYAILDCLCPEYDSSGQRAVAALAQTCRAFSEPALDRLWRKLYSLRPLIQSYAGVDGADIQTPPTDSQIAVVERYSHRIRELVVSESASFRFLQFMSMRPAPSCLFPNLEVLQWRPYSDTPHIIFIQQLLAPSLVSLSAYFAESDGPTLLSFLDNYPVLCPNLRSIEFRFLYGMWSAATTHALSRAICRQATLEKVVLRKTSVDSAAFRYLSTLPTLKVLSLSLSDLSMSETGLFLPSGPLFRSVEILDIETLDLDLVTDLVRSRDHIFHTFRLDHPARMTSEATIHLFRILTSRPHDKSLRELTLTNGDYSHPMTHLEMTQQAERYRLSYETLQPLLSLSSSLRALTIEWNEQVSLDDDDVAKLAHSLPRLEVFCLYCGRGGYPPFSTKFVTLKGLLKLIRACPALYTLGLPIDARCVPELDDPPCETQFGCLILPESPIEEPLSVAQFLFQHLPNVTAVDARFLGTWVGVDVEEVMGYERGWGQVEKYLDAFHGLCSDVEWGEDDDDDSEEEEEDEEEDEW